MKPPNHTKKLFQEAQGLLPGLYLGEVRHEDWCLHLTGKGPCNCDPVVGKPKQFNTNGDGGAS